MYMYMHTTLNTSYRNIQSLVDDLFTFVYQTCRVHVYLHYPNLKMMSLLMKWEFQLDVLFPAFQTTQAGAVVWVRDTMNVSTRSDIQLIAYMYVLYRV